MPAGRPRKEINWDMIELYLKSGCTQDKICKSLNICTDTLSAKIKEKYGMNYSELSESLRNEGDILLEAQEFQKAVKGYWPALLWLCKIRLGQREPDLVQSLAANQNHIDQRHYIMRLEHEIEELRKNNADNTKPTHYPNPDKDQSKTE